MRKLLTSLKIPARDTQLGGSLSSKLLGLGTGRIFVVSLFLALSACASPSGVVTSTALTNGLSGMARIDDSRYLAVHDDLSFESGQRISVIDVAANQNFAITPVRPNTWMHNDGRSSDLEGVCGVPGRDQEFLLVEAGHWAGEFGRMFHVKLDVGQTPYQLQVLHVYELPEFNAKGPGDFAGDEIEGIECLQNREGKTLVILGERGGSTAYPSGLLRWVTVDLASAGMPVFSTAGSAGYPIDAPGTWTDSTQNRDISALYLDDDNVLWAAATEELGDSGTFKSVVFKVASVSPDDSNPIKVLRSFSVERTIDGFKVEALAAPTPNVAGSVFAIGTEDEIYGGTWRPLK